jgi:uncharacterized membrane-anchored protein
MNKSAYRRQQLMRKVPEITAVFWIVKLLTTAMGESTSDYLVFKINPYIAVTLGGIGLVIALALQFSVRRYVAWVYWLAVLMVAIFGTMAADVLHIQLGVPYLVSTILFAVTLAAVFTVWYKSERTLSIHSINTRKRELFYWAAVMTTFALGTASGDLTAITLHLGYLASGLLFAGLIAVPVLARWLFGLNEILTFWWAYILTRPLGASFADWMGKPHRVRGLGLGDGLVSLGLAILIVGFVSYMTFDRSEARHENPA